MPIATPTQIVRHAITLLLAVTTPQSPPPLQADQIIVIKSQHTLTVLAHGKPIKTYKVALGPTVGPKEKQGDHKTPEGTYTIDSKNQQSRFYLALHVSYPNAGDKAHAKSLGHPPGGDIMIHGVEKKYEYLGDLQHNYDWTDGCIALTNPEIEELFRLIPTGTPIEIKP